MNWLKAFLSSNWQSASANSASSEIISAAKVPWRVEVVPGNRALEKILALRLTEDESVPVALGDDDDLDRTMEALEHNNASTLEIVEAAESIDIQEWFKERVTEDPDYYAVDGEELAPGPQPAQAKPLSLAFDVLSGAPKAKVHIALIPTTKPWEVPAHLKMGSWNECPEPEVHIAVFRSWFERYGAVVTGVGPDTVEFSVARPPESLEEARVLAREQFIYCADIVHQGVQSVENLARVLLKSGNWYFWWD
ncbi:DUF4253 domain-containing protein [Xanthomonas sp. D-109]|uniref:DUF4253 domain-containing protein n=1 Tax=Xanthomonas sp. D-109 TaxID=2821274 RepID=UPI001ADCBE4A|nr:DUF4253 domain-containing protein [Xanthomonas sp. D-109]